VPVNSTAAVAPFDEGHRDFGALSPLLWEPLGRALVARSAPAPGERVLDACCGEGASAVPAALAVGVRGRVDAVDGAGALIEQAKAEVGEALPQLHFAQGDVTTWRPADGLYDLVQCGYGVFLLPDMDASSARLAGLLRRGGRFAVSAWRFPALREFASCLIDAVEAELGESLPEPTAVHPAERIDNPDKLQDWLESRSTPTPSSAWEYGVSEMTMRRGAQL
jgi:ubiquinone/menaquinone biosynthesis C-methylase UbiE